MKISVLITTLNEEENLARCLGVLTAFDDVLVIDSNSTDQTQNIAKAYGARVENFTWNGGYPKKRQHALENFQIKHDFVFFVDADEIIPPELIDELQNLDLNAAGYFVKGQYVWKGQTLTHGLMNNKLALLNRHKVEFPVIDDLDIAGMGEIEGHYQPVLKTEFNGEEIGQIVTPLLHDAYDDAAGWTRRHQRYAQWEAAMISRDGYPCDPVAWRQNLKVLFRKLPLRGVIAFCHCYIFKMGFLDGKAGFDFARSRYQYYALVSAALKTNKA